MMGPGMMGGFGWGWSSPIFMVIFWGLIIWGIAAVAGGICQPSGGNFPSRPDSPLEVLKKRYARGEISKEEFEAMRRDLS
ncbi:MAG: SHOCT domain-containing protein [Chloroflexi bacterium]|nr:SHOCT domain-containing protein [Chloroflexota bacterium]